MLVLTKVWELSGLIYSNVSSLVSLQIVCPYKLGHAVAKHVTETQRFLTQFQAVITSTARDKEQTTITMEKPLPAT